MLCYHRHAGDGLVSLYAEDAILSTPGVPLPRGSAAIREGYSSTEHLEREQLGSRRRCGIAPTLFCREIGIPARGRASARRHAHKSPPHTFELVVPEYAPAFRIEAPDFTRVRREKRLTIKEDRHVIRRRCGRRPLRLRS